MMRAFGVRWCRGINCGWRLRWFPGAAIFASCAAKATVNGELAAEATLMCKMVDREPRDWCPLPGQRRESAAMVGIEGMSFEGPMRNLHRIS